MSPKTSRQLNLLCSALHYPFCTGCIYLFAVVMGRKTERHSAPRTRARVRNAVLRLSLPDIFSVTRATGPVVSCLCSSMACAFNGVPADAQVPSEENPQDVAKASSSPDEITDAETQSVAEEKNAAAKKILPPSKKRKKRRRRQVRRQKRNESVGHLKKKKLPSLTGKRRGAASAAAILNTSPTRLATARPTSPAAPLPQVDVEKSGSVGDQGHEPPPPTLTLRRGWWFWLRPEVNDHYLRGQSVTKID